MASVSEFGLDPESGPRSHGLNHPAVLLADEPSGNLDSKNRDEIHSLFFRLREELGQTTIIVTHDEGLALMADRKVTMCDGRIL